jgi:hypothetical protein
MRFISFGIFDFTAEAQKNTNSILCFRASVATFAAGSQN